MRRGINGEILLLYLFALGLRVFVVFTAAGIADDGCGYLFLAREIAGGNFHAIFTSVWPPLFPVFSAGASFIFRDLELAGRMVSCIFGSLTVFPLFFLVKSIFDKKTALMTVLFFAVHPYLCQASGEALSEALYFFFVTSVAAVSWFAIRKKKAGLFLPVGLLLLLTGLTRFEGFALIFLVLAWIFAAGLPNLGGNIRWKLASTFFCLIAFAAVLLPYMVSVRRDTGKWQITSRQGHHVKVSLNAPGETRTERAKYLLRYKIYPNIRLIPASLAKAYHPVFVPLLFFGLIGRKRLRGFRLGEIYILSFAVFRLTVLTVFAGITERYLYAFVPVTLCWAGAGFWEIDSRFQGRAGDKKLSWGLGGMSRVSMALLLVITVICLPRALKTIRGHRAVQREVGCWLKENAEQREFVVASLSPQIAFHAGAKQCRLEGQTYAELVSNAREDGADFIVADKNLDTICPDFRNSVSPDDLEIFTAGFAMSGRSILVYKLKKQAADDPAGK